jgi:hypothetical protein
MTFGNAPEITPESDFKNEASVSRGRITGSKRACNPTISSAAFPSATIHPSGSRSEIPAALFVYPTSAAIAVAEAKTYNSFMIPFRRIILSIGADAAR